MSSMSRRDFLKTTGDALGAMAFTKALHVCSPNDTHACRLRAFVRNGVILRSETNYDVGNDSDLYGNTATAHWNPRGCKKGQTSHRRVYGPHRLKGSIMRQGWKEWADDGYPYLDAAMTC